MSVVRFDEAQLEAVERERAEEEALGPLERFEKLYRTFEDEDEAAAFVQTLAAMFEVKRHSCSTDDDGQPFLMRWCTLSPNDCKLMVYRDATEGDLAETIFLRGASVVQIADGLPPDRAHLFRLCNASAWSSGLEIRRERFVLHEKYDPFAKPPKKKVPVCSGSVRVRMSVPEEISAPPCSKAV